MDTALQTRWEYIVDEFSNLAAMRDTLKSRGSDGWELVSVLGGGTGDATSPAKTLRVRRSDLLTAIFKRRKG